MDINLNDFVNTSINDLMICLNDLTTKAPSNGNAKKELEKYAATVNFNRRKGSTIIAMRKFHNWIKRTLIINITEFYYNKNPEDVYLLDIGVGRGGDIDKWNQALISGVFGFDPSEESINSLDPFNQGANARLKNYKLDVKVQFEVGNALDPSPELISKIKTFLNVHDILNFQIVSCQFALHYFFKNPTDLKIVLTFVSNFLKKGGFFLGTTIDADKIKKLFEIGASKTYSTDLFKIEREFNKKITSFYGNKYKFTINDINDQGNYFNTMGISTEYLVDFKELTRVAAEVGLLPVKINFFESYGKKVYTNMSSNVISFEDIYELYREKPPLTPAEIELNKLYSSFVFMKA